MKKLNGEQIFSAMESIDPRLLAEAMPPSWQTDSGAAPRKPKKHPFAWLDSGWAAAVLSTVVAVGVLVAIVLAGRMDAHQPHGTPPLDSTPIGADTSASASTEADTAPETIPETLPAEPVVDPTINASTVAVDLPQGGSVYIAGEYDGGEALIDGELIGSNAASLSVGDYIAAFPLTTVQLPENGLLNLRFEAHEGWTDLFAFTVYEKQNDALTEAKSFSADSPTRLSVNLPVGTYYVELLHTRTGPQLSEAEGSEWSRYRYIFRVQIVDADTVSLTEASLAVTQYNGKTFFVPGERTWVEQVDMSTDPPSILSGDLAYSSLEECIRDGYVPKLAVRVGTAPTVRYHKREGWSYTESVTVYNSSLIEVARGSLDTLATLALTPTTSRYYVELTVSARGEEIPEAGGSEGSGVRFIFELCLFEPYPDAAVSIPKSKDYVGFLYMAEDIYIDYPAWESAEFRWRVEKIDEANGYALIEEYTVPAIVFTLEGRPDIDRTFVPWLYLNDPDCLYYVHFTVLEDGEWKTVGFFATYKPDIARS